jgi:hypothetical protein
MAALPHSIVPQTSYIDIFNIIVVNTFPWVSFYYNLSMYLVVLTRGAYTCSFFPLTHAWRVEEYPGRFASAR